MYKPKNIGTLYTGERIKNRKILIYYEGFILKTSMIWPSQNFLLYNVTIIKIKVNEWINN